MKIDSDEVVENLSKLKDRYIYELIKGGEYSEWNKGILAGKIDVIDEVIELLDKGNR